MKNNNLSILLLALLILPLSGCNGETIDNDLEIIKTALSSLKRTSHNVNVKQTVSVLRPIPEGMTPEDPNWMYLPLDIHHEYNNNFGYYYGNDNEKAYSRDFNAKYCDLDKISGEPIANSIRYDYSPKEIFFKNKEDGTIYTEEITIENEYYSYTSASYDDENDIYTSVIFDLEFINPFDYITYRDVEVRKDDKSKLTLINQKADYLAECYGTVGMNFITDNTINLDENGNITSIDFVINDLVDTEYTRKNTLSITYNRKNATIEHYQPFTNNNPELQAALDILDNQKNFTYIKEFEAPFASKDTIKGYFTEEEVFFHHVESENDNHPYTKGDDYDYKSVKQSDGTYLCYEYIPNGYEFKWNVCSVSGTADYVIETFEEIGPNITTMDASIFTKTGDKTYEIEEILLPSIGTYFDYGMLGVQSGAFDGNTVVLEITLNDEGTIDYIQANFVYEMTEYEIKYYLQDVGTTVIPSWADTSLTTPII